MMSAKVCEAKSLQAMAIACMVCFIGMVQHGAGLSAKDIPLEWEEGLQFCKQLLLTLFQSLGAL
jgi:hypothetical protein